MRTIYKLMMACVLCTMLHGCKIEDPYCNRLHPHESGLTLALVLDDTVFNPSETRTFRNLLYKDGKIFLDTLITFHGLRHENVFDVPYGVYQVFCYDTLTVMQTRKENSLDDAYLFVPGDVSYSGGDIPEQPGRPIVDVNCLNVGREEIRYSNKEPFAITEVKIGRRAYNVKIRLRFTDENLNLDDISGVSGTLAGVASVLGVQDMDIWSGNNGTRSLLFSRSLAGESDPRCMYATICILGNDLETAEGSIMNQLDLKIKYTYDDKVTNFSCDLSSFLNGLDRDLNLEVKINEKGEPPVTGDITIDESWGDEEFFVPVE